MLFVFTYLIHFFLFLSFPCLSKNNSSINYILIIYSILFSEYPTPDLGDLSQVKAVQARLNLQSNPACLGLTYADMVQFDTITVNLVPEKKGIFLKHSEYQVSSKRFLSTVTRRYNDFVALHELLLARFPYR